MAGQVLYLQSLRPHAPESQSSWMHLRPHFGEVDFYVGLHQADVANRCHDLLLEGCQFPVLDLRMSALIYA